MGIPGYASYIEEEANKKGRKQLAYFFWISYALLCLISLIIFICCLTKGNFEYDEDLWLVASIITGISLAGIVSLWVLRLWIFSKAERIMTTVRRISGYSLIHKKTYGLFLFSLSSMSSFSILFQGNLSKYILSVGALVVGGFLSVWGFWSFGKYIKSLIKQK